MNQNNYSDSGMQYCRLVMPHSEREPDGSALGARDAVSRSLARLGWVRTLLASGRDLDSEWAAASDGSGVDRDAMMVAHDLRAGACRSCK